MHPLAASRSGKPIVLILRYDEVEFLMVERLLCCSRSCYGIFFCLKPQQRRIILFRLVLSVISRRGGKVFG